MAKIQPENIFINYSTFDNLKMLIHHCYYKHKKLFFLLLIEIPIDSLIPLVTMLLPSLILLLVQNSTPLHFIGIVIPLSILLALLHASSAYLEKFRNIYLIHFRLDLMHQYIYLKRWTVDFESTEKNDFQELFTKAEITTMNNNSATEEIFRCLVKIITSMALILIYVRLLLTISPILILFIIVMVAFGFTARRRSILWMSENKNNWVPTDRKLKYIAKISGDYSYAKDIRLFNMAEWLHGTYESLVEIRQGWQQKESRKHLLADLIECVLTFLREGISYGVLLFMTIQGKLSIPEFILYFAAIANFSDSLFKITKDLIELRKMSLEISDLRNFYNYPEHQHTTQIFLKKDDFPCAISLSNVKYIYDGAKKETLKGIDLEITAGEKIAIVGLNGAGKTTLIKIICGLLTPSEGSILISGHNRSSFSRNDYYKLFSVVFQDFAIFPTTIAKTIAQCKDEDIDIERVINCLEKADLYDYVMSLPNGLHSKLRKEVYHDAVTPSGGLMQRLMLARAIYKDAPIMILDEPTAALDPIAESNIYKHYNEITEGKTAIYISHRLASTQFCDRIILMENGQIAEEGTHTELMDKGGKYYKLYETQSSYYRDNIEKDNLNGGRHYEFVYDKA